MRETGRFAKTVRVAALMGFLVATAWICTAQKPTPGTGFQVGAHQAGNTPTGLPGTGSVLDGLDSNPAFPDSARQRRNDERQRRIVSDTQKLLTLTSQLKAEVASTGAEAMSPEMLRQMDEIEKLARSVKDRMRD